MVLGGRENPQDFRPGAVEVSGSNPGDKRRLDIEILRPGEIAQLKFLVKAEGQKGPVSADMDKIQEAID